MGVYREDDFYSNWHIRVADSSRCFSPGR